MARELKVYGTMDFLHGKQVRIIVAERSFAAAKRAARAVGMDMRRDYTSATGNPEELRVALPNPGVVYFTRDPVGGRREYVPVPTD
jgi:hypothetical protein